MSTKKVWPVVLAALAAASFACSSLGSIVSSSASTAVSAVQQTAGASTGGTEAPSSTSSGPSATASAGNVPVPTDTVAYEKGKVYDVGQAVKDDKTGVVFQVNDVKFDSSLAGLSSGQTWALITITLGNAGTASYSASSIASFGVKSKSTGQSYSESLSAILSQVVTPETQLDKSIDPGTAFQGILPVIVPDSATGLTVSFTPIEYISESLTFEVNLGK